MPKHFRPKLGQHFLADRAYRQRILEELALEPEDCVVEIGAGTGAMTSLLAERARKIIAVELDDALAGRLAEEVRELPQVEILRRDILSVDFRALRRRLRAGRFFVFGNIPYYITSPILHHLLDSSEQIRAMGLLMQEEVAERLISAPGARDYGYLTVRTQWSARPRIALRVPPGAFSPPPQVRSALVMFQVIRPPLVKSSEAARFEQFSKQCFAQKRKTLANNLGAAYPREKVEAALAALSLSPTARAEEISVQTLIKLFRHLRTRRER